MLRFGLNFDVEDVESKIIKNDKLFYHVFSEKDVRTASLTIRYHFSPLNIHISVIDAKKIIKSIKNKYGSNIRLKLQYIEEQSPELII